MNSCANLSDAHKCLLIIAHGNDALHDGNITLAEGSFRAALVLTRSKPELDRDLFPLVHLSLSLLRQRQGREDESRDLRKQAMGRLEESPSSCNNSFFHRLMANTLMGAGEYQKAIPFWEKAIRLEAQDEDASSTADMLWRAGECYSRSGLKDHAAVLLDASAKIFRNHTADPRLPAVLIALGNALRKTSPARAESCYREAADLHVARGHFQSATTAWVNIGILCSEQGRHDECLELYQRVLRIREQSPGTPAERIGAVLNNIANCYRRMGKFQEALASLDRAQTVLEKTGGSGLAAAYGSRGLTFRDQGNDKKAVLWLRRAYDVHQQLPSPDLQTIAEDLENEIAALKRLNKQEETNKAQQRLASVLSKAATIPRIKGEFSAPQGPPHDAVLVEVNAGSPGAKARVSDDFGDFVRRLRSRLESDNVGYYIGSAVVPESTTLVFYGEDAEAVFRALEPSLVNEPICAGGRVTIRRRGNAREIILPHHVM